MKFLDRVLIHVLFQTQFFFIHLLINALRKKVFLIVF